MTPNIFAKPLIALLFGLFTASHEISAAPLGFPAQDFSLELPAGWTQVTPTPDGTLSVAVNPSGNTRLIIFGKAMRPPNLAAFQTGLRKTLVQSGVELQPDQQFKVGDHTFVMISGRHAAKNMTVADYLTISHGHIITFAIAIDGTLTASDPDINSIIGSFQSPAAADSVPVAPATPAKAK